MKDVKELLVVPDDIENLIEQPLSLKGWRYHAPCSRSDRTYWLFNGDRKHYDSVDVAEATGIDVRKLREWENAADLLAEKYSRDEYGDW